MLKAAVGGGAGVGQLADAAAQLLPELESQSPLLVAAVGAVVIFAAVVAGVGGGGAEAAALAAATAAAVHSDHSHPAVHPWCHKMTQS